MFSLIKNFSVFLVLLFTVVLFLFNQPACIKATTEIENNDKIEKENNKNIKEIASRI